ncbi:shikimate kinase [Microbacterium sp. ABRD28]|uniref:shikimate kinase n=1 Tax=Microbacterium sp. ABRD28 TaxID=2268461 RepID=UPI000F554E5C|nr:shikimate kinase [Microbacterium sp. ABRD28]AZC13942.1 shikimate kinase [Microbacterium sp. ABRD28]
MTSPSEAIVLIGPMGAGKTSLGKRVARRLGVPFTDTDAGVVREHGPIERIFADHGEAEFRRLERETVARALRTGGVVSLGGGAVLDPDTQRDLERHRVVLLTVAPRVVAHRLRDTARPLLQDEDPMTRWNAILAERLPLYRRLADATFDTSTGPLQKVVDAIVAWAETPQKERA